MSTSENASKELRMAWMWTALIPVGYFAGIALGEILFSALGGSDTTSSVLVKAGASIPALAVMVLPGIQAARIGRTAFLHGAKGGRWPSIIGIVYLIFVGTVTLAGIFMTA